MNALSFSLFNYHGNLSSEVPFASYFRGLSFNIKMAELLYPGWRVHCTLDTPTYEGFKDYFDYHVDGSSLNIDVIEPDKLCKMMLHRIRPIFTGNYDRLLCRDLDSLISYRERQAVEYWISTGRIVHCMTDSVSHNIALMGGMVGFMCKQFKEIMAVMEFDDLVRMGRHIDYSVKGADQDFLNRVVLPKVSNPAHPTIVEHYLLGRAQSWLGECFNYVQDIEIEGVSREMEETNAFIEHIGADGFKQDRALMFFEKHLPPERLAYHAQIEDQFKEVFYWRNEI